MDWDAKLRVFVALFYYHWHAIDPCTIRALAPLLVPSTPHVIEVTQIFDPISKLYSELQSDICDAHERVARSWLAYRDGQDLLNRQTEKRYVKNPHIHLSKVLMTVGCI